MERFLSWLDEQAACLREESQKLTADHRRDEGDFAKISANVYGICKSVLQVLDSEKAKAKLSELYSTWSNKLEEARGHDDVKQAVIEEIKLETLAGIQAKLKEV